MGNTLGTAPSCSNINSRAQSRVHKDMDEEEATDLHRGLIPASYKTFGMNRLKAVSQALTEVPWCEATQENYDTPDDRRQPQTRQEEESSCSVNN